MTTSAAQIADALVLNRPKKCESPQKVKVLKYSPGTRPTGP
jgi:hypothetical protein